MLFDYEKCIRGEETRVICHYAEASSKYMHTFGKSKQSTYTKYYDFKNQYGWSLSQKRLCVNMNILKIF